MTNPIFKRAQTPSGRGSGKRKEGKDQEIKPKETIKISEEEISDKQYAFLQSML